MVALINHLLTYLLIISGMDKATNFKFGRYIHRVHPNKSPLKIWENTEGGHIQGLPKFLKYPLMLMSHIFCRNVLSVFTVFGI